MASDNETSVIKIVAELISNQGDSFVVTPTSIEGFIDKVLALHPSWGQAIRVDIVRDELIRRFAVTIGRDRTLLNSVGHVQWLDSARAKDWQYWPRYREYLERKMSLTSVEAIDRSTDQILGMLEDPLREGVWDRRGMVVGHVQSGKTASYTGLICKAADAGYKVIIVLAGLHNNLRAQTQIRIEEGFLGSTTPQDSSVPVGVGLLHKLPPPNCPTIRTQSGDFAAQIARNLAISPEDRPWIFVVKKNKSVLQKLNRWVESRVTDIESEGRKQVARLPLLVIDDEADHASVDTGEQLFDGDGQPDPEHEPTAINRNIRILLNSFQRSAYVGYTATPFANIFIHERAETRLEGPDLFPSAFIQNLATPSNYIGPVTVFGRRVGNERTQPIPLLRVVTDAVDTPQNSVAWMPAGHAKDHIPLVSGSVDLPPSLKTAIHSFMLSCAARYCRDQRNEHMSMLIHVTRFTAVQKEVLEQVRNYVTTVRQLLTRRTAGFGELEHALRALWEDDFISVTHAIRSVLGDGECKEPELWADVLHMLPDVLSDIHVKMINGTAKDALEYDENSEKGLKVIAIGGDKLARGLTLEGLSVSYFLRASKMYDTLMQMGRWFGYRPGYLDLMRLFTTSELIEWFEHITDASEELREEFDLMEASGSTPREYGLRVQSHPVLLVTSRLKMRTARDLRVSFSGEIVETVAFHTRQETLKANWNSLSALVMAMGHGTKDPAQKRGVQKLRSWKGSYLWEAVPSNQVVDFLRNYKSHPDSYKTDTLRIAEFIELMNAEGELTAWNVALLGGGEGANARVTESVSVETFQRSRRGGDENKLSIGRLVSPIDETIDVGEVLYFAALDRTIKVWEKAEAEGKKRSKQQPNTPSGISIRALKGELGIKTGLLMIYLIDPRASGLSPEIKDHIVGVALSFPGSKSDVRVTYKINNIAFNAQYGPSE